MTNKKVRSSKKQSFSEQINDAKSPFELDDLSYRKRNKKSRRKLIELESNNREILEQNGDVNKKSKLESKRGSKSRIRNEKEKKNSSTKEKFKLTSKTKNNKLNNGFIQGGKNNNYTNNKEELLDEYLILNNNTKIRMGEGDNMNSNSFISLEDSFKSISEFNNSNSSIPDSHVYSNSDSNSNSEFDSNSESVNSDTHTNSYSDLESNVEAFDDSVSESNKEKTIVENLNNCLSLSSRNLKKEENQVIEKNERLNVNDIVMDDYECLFDEIMEEKNQIKNSNNKKVQRDIKVKSALLNNNSIKYEIANGGCNFEDTTTKNKLEVDEENKEQLNNKKTNSKEKIKLGEFIENKSKIDDITQQTVSNGTTIHRNSSNYRDDMSIPNERDLLDNQDNLKPFMLTSKSEMSSPKKFSKRKLLYSFANSVWDYMKPVSLDELEKRQSELSKTNEILDNDDFIIESDDYSKEEVINKNEQELNNDQILMKKDSSDVITFNSELGSKSQNEITTNIKTNGSESNEILKNQEKVEIPNRDSSLGTPIRNSKRQMLYKFANSIWDYMKPATLDEQKENDENDDIFSELNNNADLDVCSNSKSSEIVIKNNQTNGSVIGKLMFVSGNENDTISDTEFLIDKVEDNCHSGIEDNKQCEIHVFTDEKNDLYGVDNTLDNELNKDVAEIICQSENSDSDYKKIDFQELNENFYSSVQNLFIENNHLSGKLNEHSSINFWRDIDIDLNQYQENNNINLTEIIDNESKDRILDNVNTKNEFSNDYNLNSNNNKQEVEELNSQKVDTNNDHSTFVSIGSDFILKDKDCLFEMNNQLENNSNNLFSDINNLILSPIEEEINDCTKNCNNNVENTDKLDNYYSGQQNYDNQESLIFMSLSTDKFTDEKIFLDEYIRNNSSSLNVYANYGENENDNKNIFNENTINNSNNSNSETCYDDNEKHTENEINPNSNQLEFPLVYTSSISSYSKETINSTSTVSENVINIKKTNKNRKFNRLYKLNKKIRILSDNVCKSIIDIKKKEEEINNIIESRKIHVISLSKTVNIEIIDNHDNIDITKKLEHCKVVSVEINEIKENKNSNHKYTTTDDIELNINKNNLKVDKETNTEEFITNGIKQEDCQINKKSDVNSDKSSKLDKITGNEIYKVLENVKLNSVKLNKEADLRLNSNIVFEKISDLKPNSKSRLVPYVIQNDSTYESHNSVNEKKINNIDCVDDNNRYGKREKYLKPKINKYEIIESGNMNTNKDEKLKTKNYESSSYNSNNYNRNKTSIKNGIGNSYLNYLHEYSNFYNYNCNNNKTVNSEYPESNSGSEYSSSEKLPKQCSKYYFYRYYNPKVPEVADSHIKIMSNKSNNHYNNTNLCDTDNYLSHEPNNSKLRVNSKNNYTNYLINKNYNNNIGYNNTNMNLNYNYKNYYNCN
ncbi:hypothetical protein FG386_002812 [Cryptosporidium ryanae]|uniref:uncharacterized protein n=1 Tax=Cryptosporidium ryanae TaxID=515981 RepID=UPI00351A6C2D|nr:hypothetical protein FG386_002812 [Cryptosporidium ryanae]